MPHGGTRHTRSARTKRWRCAAHSNRLDGGGFVRCWRNAYFHHWPSTPKSASYANHEKRDGCALSRRTRPVRGVSGLEFGFWCLLDGVVGAVGGCLRNLFSWPSRGGVGLSDLAWPAMTIFCPLFHFPNLLILSRRYFFGILVLTVSPSARDASTRAMLTGDMRHDIDKGGKIIAGAALHPEGQNRIKYNKKRTKY